MRRNLMASFAALFALSVVGMFPPQARAWDRGGDDKDKKSSKAESKKTSDDDDADDATDSADKKKPRKEKKSPIKKLIEVKIDQNLIAAKMLNIPLPGKTRTVRELADQFDKWRDDDEVGAVLLNLDGVNLALPDVEELRAAVSRMRSEGKKVIAYLSGGDPMSYLLACEADEIGAAPTGSLAIPGLGRVFGFMRGYYQMMGVEYDVITAGRFKYPGFMNQREPNKYFKQEFGEILDGWYGDYVNIIAEGRKMEPQKVKDAIDIALFNAEEAKNRGLVDTIAYYDDFAERVAKKLKFKKVAEYDSVFSNVTSLQDLLSAWGKEIEKAQEKYKEVGPKIAVLNARGPIVDMSLGAGYSSMLIMRDDFVKTIEEIRKNKTIKAVVLRIDSPGGSGYASDIIWKKLKQLDEEKPLVVSMGTVAGSGGYYIACPGRLIYSEPTTITGSIGVLAILANQASALNRSDINVHEMTRGARALFGAGFRGMLPEDRDFLQKYILDFYEVFLDRVADGRKMPKNEVRKLAEGRIYTGRQALEVGLVDRLGGLDDAITAAREFANIPPSAEIKLVDYPRPATFGEFFETLAGVNMMSQVAAMAQTPTPIISFDSQVRFFGTSTAPLCWMAIPDADLLYGPAAARMTPFDLMSAFAAPKLPLPISGPAR
ncbi:MAG: signal peptide peptidase SppA [Planctomycetia bacterium]|nr:signal peptide peptidase SppA [Planctomycetia bacterium]MCC7316873.1 signal peptide peptidase SppA [Planctomycetota bacterium]